MRKCVTRVFGVGILTVSVKYVKLMAYVKMNHIFRFN